VPRLRRVDCHSPGITRRRCGRGFIYLERGKRISDPGKLARIRALTIPPAWADVWVCSDEVGHLQAVGTDAAGRKQYLYHVRWRERRDQEKFDRMLAFARSLATLRVVTAEQISGEGLTRERVLACAVRLLDQGLMRIGGEEYADEDGGYGLATLEQRHVRIENGAVLFDYAGKGGKHLVQSFTDPEVHEIVGALKRRRGGGPSLLAYKNAHWVTVRSDDINAHLKEIAGAEFSAKDFRTWHATVLAAIALAESPPGMSKAGRERAIVDAIEQAAERLGNTPAVCRASYIDPRLFERFRANDTIARAVDRIGRSDRSKPATRQKIERAVVALLD
jgi:DNA topoisomerase-1